MFGIDNIVSVGLEIINKVIPDPQAKLVAQERLLQMQQDKELKEEDFDIKREEIAAGDRDSARKMQSSALESDSKLAKEFIYYYTAFWSLASSAYIAFITFAVIPEKNVRFADTILGFILGTAVASMFTYFYGSSNSSKAKDNTIKNLMQK